MKTILAAATAWGLAISAGIALARLPQLRLPPGSRSVVALLFGGARAVLSDDMYQRADLYYHGGVAHRHEPGGEHHQTETPAEAASSQGRRFSPLSEESNGPGTPPENGGTAAGQPRGYSIIVRGEDHADAKDHEHDHEGGETATARWDLWTRLNRRIHPSGHRHLRGPRYEKEVLPWLWVAIRCNPHNVTAYDVAAYWVAERLKRPQEGLKIVREGIRNNPDAYRLELTRGEILLHMLKKREAAFNAFHTAMRKWQKAYARASDKNKPDTFQYGNILLYLAVLSERRGALEDARRYYKAALETRQGDARRDIARRLAGIEKKLGAPRAAISEKEKAGG